MGAALLVKGVIAFMIVAIICIFKFIFSHEKRFKISTYYDTFIISTIALMLYLPWFFLMNFSTKWAYFYYMHDDLFVRATTALDPFHIHGLLFYVGSIVLDFRVWIIFLLLVPFIVIGSKNQAGIHKYYFLLTWILVVFIGFSIPISKLVWYVYPLYPALALLLAYNIDISFAFFKKLGRFYKLAFIGFITIILLISLILVFLNSENVKVIGVHKFVKIYQQQKNPQFFIDPALNYSTLTRSTWTDFYLDKISNKTEGIPKTNKSSCIFLLTENKSMVQKVPADKQIKLDFFAANKPEAYILNFCVLN
jgi:4-amino-4-deoxy-L-arabinose transferase-like glycosyltransferase